MIDGTRSGLEPRETQRALFIVEILMRILRNLVKLELAAAARVCRTWTDVALDMLWEELESVHPIMALLGPITKTGDGWDWENGFPSGEWTRFTSYVKRLRSLSYCTTGQPFQAAFHPICSHVPTRWIDYAASHHGQYLLPEIRKINWACYENDQLEMIPFFLSPTIKDVRIRTGWDVYPKAMDRLLKALRTALPSGVRVFQFMPQDMESGEETSEIIKSLVESLDELQEIRLPGQRMAPFMFKPGRL